MDPNKPMDDRQIDVEQDVEKKPDAQAEGGSLPHSDRFKKPIDEREEQVEKRLHNELTEE